MADASFVQIQNKQTIGRLDVHSTATAVTIDYFVDDNGRGPKHKQALTLDANGLPLSGQITGTSLMGGKVDESFVFAKSRFTWTSQADHGDLKRKEAGLYIVNDSNPYDLALYARYLLKQPGQEADVLPEGHLRLVTLKAYSFAGATVTAYRLDGLNLEPSYVLLDDTRELFASMGGGDLIVRKGYEAEADKLGQLAGDLEAARQRDLQAKLGHTFIGPVRIKNVRIFDPRTGGLSPLSSVYVIKDRIATILPEDLADENAPLDETLIDGDGGTLVPGLHDMHSHTTDSSGLFLLAAGITAVRDMGNYNDFLDQQIALLDTGEIAGPRIIANGFIEGKSPYSANTGIVVASQAEADKAVRWYADNGYFQLKIYNSFNPAWIKPTAAEAHRLGMNVVGHIPAFYTPDQAINDGYDEITHINQLVLGWLLKPTEDTRTPLRLTGLARAATLDLESPPVQHTLGLMTTHHTSLDTTAVIVERLMLSRAGTALPADQYYLDHMPIAYQRYRKRTYLPLKSPEDDASYFKAFDKLVDVMRLLHTNGIQFLPGTDDTLGFSLRRELELYVKAGMTPAEALKVGTLDMETYLHRDQELGTIERGKLADFFLVKSDPTQDITALHDTRMVLKGGFVYFPDEIYESLGIKPFTTAPKIILPAQPRTPAASAHSGGFFDAFD
ncbi:amidohydrolase family protein [Asticcacaulis sp. 201]|uniref:amidohydrolase family protein n=1 Tax=Asticcacaulis sp. 201 TaxID=3028787 RepID=UPI0029170423|nr:amidohydrolase family protein [Asticcacaulis sp. 201]MDV6332946.1 amidohydrolase family protein [Asticcacaulis sp. 201]